MDVVYLLQQNVILYKFMRCLWFLISLSN